MNDEQINIAIAEVLGFKKEVGCTGITRWRNGGELFDKLKDYANDLNAMHEAEKVLSSKYNLCTDESQWSNYLEWLGYCWENKTSDVFQCVHATARQRAEAFLRAIGKWEEVKP